MDAVYLDKQEIKKSRNIGNAATSPMQPIVVSTVKRAKFCAKCGSALGANDKFCTKCGWQCVEAMPNTKLSVELAPKQTSSVQNLGEYVEQVHYADMDTDVDEPTGTYDASKSFTEALLSNPSYLYGDSALPYKDSLPDVRQDVPVNAYAPPSEPKPEPQVEQVIDPAGQYVAQAQATSRADMEVLSSLGGTATRSQVAQYTDMPVQSADIRPQFDMGPVKKLVDVDQMFQTKEKLSKKERKARVLELRQQQKELKAEMKENKADIKNSSKEQAKKTGRSIKSQIKAVEQVSKFKISESQKAVLKSKSATGSIGYDLMFKDGLCQVAPGLFSETIEFSDISYQSINEEAQKGVFKAMCNLIDYFGANMLLQYNVINTPLLKERIGQRKFYSPEAQSNQNLSEFAEIYNDILNTKMKEGVSNIRRRRFLTYSIGAENADRARQSCARIRSDVQAKLGSVGAQSNKLNGTKRLEVINSLLRSNKEFGFNYDRDLSIKTGLSTKDYIAPSHIDFKPNQTDYYMKIDDVYAQVLVVRGFGSEINDQLIASIVDLPIPMNVTWYLQGIEKHEGVLFAKQRLAFVHKDVADYQKKNGVFTSLPADVEYSKKEAEKVLVDLLEKNQRLINFTGLIYTYAETVEDLEEQVLQIARTAKQGSMYIETYDLRQKEGLNSILPLGNNYCEISRMFTTAQGAILTPFATQEIEELGGRYVGQNRISKNLIIPNRLSLASPMGFIAGKPGSGKSFAVKQEIMGTILSNPNDEIFIIDKAGEYTWLTEAVGGQVIDISTKSTNYLNFMDLVPTEQIPYMEQIPFKQDAFVAQATATGLQTGENTTQGEQSIILRCVEQAYALAKNRGEMPKIEHFYNTLLVQTEPEAQQIALKYEPYVKGAMSFTNNYSNVSYGRVNDLVIKNTPRTMTVFTLINICEAIRNRMYSNFEKGIRTYVYLEEIQSLFAYPTVLNYFSNFAREGRKFNTILTGITQNTTEMLQHEAARDIVLNSDYIYLLKQSPEDRKIWKRLLNLSEVEEGYIDERTPQGDGFLIHGAARVAVEGNFPEGNVLFDIFNTDPNKDTPYWTKAKAG